MTNFKHITNSKNKIFYGNIYFFDKKVFNFLKKKENKLKDLSINQYVEFRKDSEFIEYLDEKRRVPLVAYGWFDSLQNNVFVKEKNNIISELFICTTDAHFKRERKVTYKNKDLLELERKKFIIIDRDKNLKEIKSIKTNLNISIKELFGAKTKKMLDEAKRYLRLTGGKKRYIQDKIKNKIGTKTEISYEPLNEANIKNVLDQALLKNIVNFRVPLNEDLLSRSSGDYIINDNNIIEITSGKLVISNSNFESYSFDVPIGKYKIYEKYDKTFDQNISKELDVRAYQNEMLEFIEIYNQDEEEAIKHGYDPDYWTGIKDFAPREPNIHFLYIDFMKKEKLG